MTTEDNNIDKLIAGYIALDDKRRELKAAFTDKDEQMQQMQDRIKAHLASIMGEQGLQNMRSPSGTVYFAEQTSVSVEDWPTFLNYCVTNDRLDLIKKGASKDAVVAFREENDDLPPGVGWRQAKEARVRRT